MSTIETKTYTGKRPVLPTNEATVCKHTIGDIAKKCMDTNPQKTPNSAYMKKY